MLRRHSHRVSRTAGASFVVRHGSTATRPCSGVTGIRRRRNAHVEISEVTDINENGWISGASRSESESAAVLWSPTGAVIELDSPPGHATATPLGLNDHLTVVGSAPGGPWRVHGDQPLFTVLLPLPGPSRGREPMQEPQSGWRAR